MTEFDDTTLARFWSKVKKDTRPPVHVHQLGSCWEWTGSRLPRYGYGKFRFQGAVEYAHRASWIINVGSIPKETPCVLHLCDNPPCVNPAHLRLGTHADNNRDRELKGRGRPPRGDANGSRLHPERVARGEKCGASKLTEADVRGIRSRAAVSERYHAIAASLSISVTTVGRTVRRETWRHV